MSRARMERRARKKGRSLRVLKRAHPGLWNECQRTVRRVVETAALIATKRVILSHIKPLLPHA